ncbi:hypothetical protein ACFE04_023180 [Oxalis oulophora]
MASSHFLLIIFLLNIVFLLQPTSANLHKLKTLQPNLYHQQQNDNQTEPTVFFQVTKPITLTKTKPCTHHILQHDFGYTYGNPPVFANYTPPSHCQFHKFSKIVLRWHATCKGRQFDRIFGVWLNGVELLRSCTAEPRATGIVWTVEKDITRYYSLLTKNEIQLLAVSLRNIVDKTYTGVYHVDISIDFYPADEKFNGYAKNADLILPISRSLPSNDGLWFEIENSTEIQVKEFQIPSNVYRAVLEVYVSFHENDEFWYGNVPNDYITVNNLTGYPGNGAFREVLVSLDGNLVGAVWPFTVVYTGGINPLLWRPITGIGSFDLPTYDIEITPLLGNILDGKGHTFGFSVTNALNVWYIDANLHLWLDHKSEKTKGKLLKQSNIPLSFSLDSDFKGLDGTFLTKASRMISTAGWVNSSYGKITTSFTQDFNYRNSMVMGNSANLQIVDQTINFNDSVSTKMPKGSDYLSKSAKTFEMHMFSDIKDQGNGTASYITNVTLGFNEDKSKSGSLVSSLNNTQNGQGVMVVKNNLVVSGVGSTQEVYRFNDHNSCYFRNISSSNYTILYDEESKKCDKKSGFGIIKWWNSLARRKLVYLLI